MNFKESVEYLYGLGNEVLAMKLGLENIRILLAALGNPQNKYKKVQVAGTNGKGSTCAFLEAICVQAGINVGLTTSPHLISITERIKINGGQISERDFARHAAIIRKTSERLVAEEKLETVPTFFEQVTAIALNAFAEAGIVLAILETGLGGRFDATTAADAEIAAITPIDYDHQHILGKTLSQIASEKAAIIRRETKAVSAIQPKEALDVIFQRCAELGVSLKFTGEVKVETISDLKNQTINFKTEKSQYKNVRLNLPGRHQVENAKTAVLLAEILQENFKITGENIAAGLQTAIHKGRLEFYKNFLFDGAHNISGAKALRDFLDEFVKQPVTMIFGTMRDKDVSEIAEILFPKADKLILTMPDNPRSLLTSELEKVVPPDFAKENVFLSETVADALKIAEEISSEKDLILITGSLYLVGEAQNSLEN